MFGRKKAEAAMEGWFLIVGLGNPGRQYEATRHNIGFEVIDYLSKEHKIKVNKIKFKALLGEGTLGGQRVILAKPQTFMNLSGESVREITSYYKIPAERTIIVYDDISLPTGSIRIRAKGSAGGHNGMKSIIYQLQTDEFPRLRIGVGAPQHENYDLADYVLGHFGNGESEDIINAVKTAPDALISMMCEGIDKAGAKFNRGSGKPGN